jgi:hypothetical protein
MLGAGAGAGEEGVEGVFIAFVASCLLSFYCCHLLFIFSLRGWAG